MAIPTDFRVKNGLVVTTTATILGTTQSNSTTTGALIVSGGSALQGNLNVFGDATVGTTTKASLLTVNNTVTSALNIRSNAGFVSPNSLNTITVRMLDSDVLTFSGAAGQLFSISDSFTGTIFAVNDISGVPSIEVYDTGLVSLAEFTGNVGIGTTSTTAKLTVNGGVRISGVTTVTNTSNATSTTTGALQIVGGAGIGRDVWIGGSLNVSGGINATVSGTITTATTISITNDTASTTAQYISFVSGAATSPLGTALKIDTADLVFIPNTGRLGIGSLNPASKLDVTGDARISGITTVTNTTNSTSTTTGALIVNGGIGIGRDVWIGGSLNVASGLSATTGLQLNNNNIDGVNRLQFTDPGPGEGIDFNSNFQIYESPDDLVTNTGGNLQFVANGVRRVTFNTNGQVSITTNTNSTSTITGALIVSGGVGIGRDVWIGGSLNVAGTVNATASTASTVITVQSTSTNTHFLTFVDTNNTSSLAELIYTTSSFVINPSSGNVGIGTTNPQRRLTVQSDNGATVTAVALYNADTTNGNGTVVSFRTNTTGTSSATFHEVSGFQSLTTDHNHLTRNTNFSIFTDSSSTGVSLKLTVTGEGNVGIGTQTPGFNLDVVSPTNSIIRALGSNIGRLSLQNSTRHYSFSVQGSTLFFFDETAGFTRATINSSGVLTVSTTTNSTSTTTGALVVTGGVGIGGSTVIGGTANIINTTSSTSTITGALVVTGGVGAGGNLYVGGSVNILSNGNTVTTASWEKWKFITVGTTSTVRQGSDGNGLNFTTNAIWTGTAWQEDYSPQKKFAYIQHIGNGRHEFRTASTGTGVSWVTTLSLDENSATLNRPTSITDATNATSTTTGALVVTGGAGIGGNLYVSGEIVAQRLTIQLTTITTTLVQTDDIIQTVNTSNATSTTTGALQVAGGAGIGRDLYVGGTIYGNIVGTLTGNAGTVSTVRQDSSNNHFLTFVDANNASATAEAVYTTATVVVNPQSSSLGIGTATLLSGAKVTVSGGGVHAQAIVANGSPDSYADAGGLMLSYAGGTGFIRAYSNTSGTGTTSIAFQTSGTTQATIDSAGNIGLGITPSAWGGGYKSYTNQLYGEFYSANAGFVGIAANVFYNGTSWIYKNTTAASRYEQPLGNGHAWHIAPSGTVGTTATFTQAMALNANGVLSITTNTNAASTTTGALVVTGGAGIGGDLYARNIYSNGSQLIPLKMEEFTATASQTTFTVTGGYIVGTVMVFANGIFLNSGDFTASNGTTVVLTFARNAGDIIKVVSGGTSSASNQQQSFSIAMSVALGM